MSVSPEEYIGTRLEDQIEWYNKKSSSNQRMYKRLQLITIISSSSIPFLSAYIAENNYIAIFVGIIGVTVAAITAVNSLYKFQENWIAYRSTCESLKLQKYLYLTGTEPYHEKETFNLLVQNVEMIISKENGSWSKQMDKQPDKSPITSAPLETSVV
ncbi:hypothetical protein OKW21_002542 [Catalinimonas alkaloidigena]|uniref:DUF4231 domain-containing protein n=1 Tax=Catalinimonas alkaloidigena TaxID=1075417 RepID=UPI0024060651|nr:DUF4231 domain-containing protein [Catalinimonas alkaloidigena]MDF9797279.1 hypothetical protein [Catalinimonas alkaloidigena]